MKKTGKLFALTLFTCVALGAAAAYADDFPKKDIICVWTSKVGTGGDLLLRTLGKMLQPKLNGHAMVVENRVGAGGANGFMAVNKARPDGYTLLCTSSTLPIAKLVSSVPLGHDDFKMVCGFMFDPQFIYCKADKPYNNLKELIEYAKAHPGEMNWGRSQPTSIGTVTMAMVVGETGIKVNSIVFDSGNDVLTGVLGGHVDVGFGEYGDIKSQIEAGQFKALCVFNDERAALLPDVPTAKENGFDLVIMKARGIAAPKNTPDAVVDTLCNLFKFAYDLPEFQAYVVGEGAIAQWMPKEKLKEAYDSIADIVIKNKETILGR